MKLACAVLLMSACVAQAKPCPAIVGVANDGRFYMDHQGPWVRQSPDSILNFLKGGCYPEGGPSPTSSVTLMRAPHAPPSRLDLLLSILAQAGWPKERVTILHWSNPPQRPRAIPLH